MRGQRKCDIAVGQRAYEEISRLFPSTKDAAKALNIDSPATIYTYIQGVTPSTYVMIKLYYLGADIAYIFSGRRATNEIPRRV